MERLLRIVATVLAVTCIAVSFIYDAVLKQYMPDWMEGTPGWIILCGVITVCLCFEIGLKLTGLRRKRQAKRWEQQES